MWGNKAIFFQDKTCNWIVNDWFCSWKLNVEVTRTARPHPSIHAWVIDTGNNKSFETVNLAGFALSLFEE